MTSWLKLASDLKLIDAINAMRTKSNSVIRLTDFQIRLCIDTSIETILMHLIVQKSAGNFIAYIIILFGRRVCYSNEILLLTASDINLSISAKKCKIINNIDHGMRWNGDSLESS